MIQKRQRRRRDGSTYSVFRVRWYERDGRERSRTFDTMGDARAFEGRVRALKRAESLDTLDAGRETLADFTAEWWEIYAKPNLERATLKGYASLWNAHVLPRLGHLRLRDITVRTVAGFRARPRGGRRRPRDGQEGARAAAGHPPARRRVGAARREPGARGPQAAAQARPRRRAAAAADRRGAARAPAQRRPAARRDARLRARLRGPSPGRGARAAVAARARAAPSWSSAR